MPDYISSPVAALRSEPTDQGPLISELLYGEQVDIQKRGDEWSLVENLFDRHTGYVRSDALAKGMIMPAIKLYADPLVTARSFLGVPYKWGGRTIAGLDCSALVQLSFAPAGVRLPRNAGPQCKVLEKSTSFEKLQPSDLLFLLGHVMIATDRDHVIHANGKRMIVCEMSIDEALAERKLTRADLILKKYPTAPGILDTLRQDNPINYNAFLGLSGPDIMS